MNYSSIINPMCFNKALVAVFLAFTSAQAEASVWDMFGQQEQMKDYVIADVGEVSKVQPPFNSKWEKEVYRMNGRCFQFSGYAGYLDYGQAALLLVNAQKNIQLALIESAIGGTKVELKSIAMIKCP